MVNVMVHVMFMVMVMPWDSCYRPPCCAACTKSPALCWAVLPFQVGILRRGRYVKGKQVGKGNVVEVGDIVKRGQVSSGGAAACWAACRRCTCWLPKRGEGYHVVEVGETIKRGRVRVESAALLLPPF